MRRWFLGPLLLGLAVQASARDPEPAGEPAVPEKLDKLTLTLNPGGHTATVTNVFFTPDSQRVVTVSADHSIRLWDARSGETVKVLYPPGLGGLAAAALSPDGKTLAVGSRYPDGDKTLHVIYFMSLVDGRVERVLKGHPQVIEALAFSADGKRLASTSAGKDGTVWIWNAAKDQPEQKFRFAGDPSSIFRVIRRGLAFSPDGSRLARVRLSGGPGDILDLATGKAVAKLGGMGPVAWSPDGKNLATAQYPGQGILLWNPDGTVRLQLSTEKGKECNSLAFSADSRSLLATWGAPDQAGTAIFDVATGKQRVKPAVKRPKSGALSADGQLAATTAKGRGIHGMTVWKTADGAIVQQAWPALAIYMASKFTGWSADGTAITWPAPPQGKRRAFNLANLEFAPPPATKDFRGPVHEQGGLSLEKGKVIKGGATLATLPGNFQTLVGTDRVAATAKGVIVLYEASTGKEIRRFQGHHDEVNELVASPDGRFLLSTSTDQTLKVWNLERDKPLLSLYVQGNDWIAWTEEGYYAATPGGERLMGWKVDNGIDQAASFYPAEQFRKVLYRPDVLKLVLARGSVEAALQAANKARGAQHQEVPRGVANPEKLLPPGVSLAVVDQSKLPKVVLQASARQSCPEQPIKSLRLLVDGRPLPNRQASVFFPEGKEQAQHEQTWTVELPPGKHKLSVLARSKDDTPNASNAVAVACPLPEEERPVVHHLAVGISGYDDPKLKLTFADADARQLADAVAGHCAGPGNLYRAVRSTRLLNQDASRKAVLDAIDAVRKTAKANDLFLLSFAGHGVREEGEFYLLTREANPTDARSLEKTAVSGAALREKLADFPCQVLLLLDACHSGAFGAGALAGYKPGSDEAARALADVDVRVAVMCAALGHEEALEQQGNGLFTRAVLRALRRDPDCFFDHQTGELNVYHLQAFVSQEVAKASDYQQTPFLKMPLASPPFVVTQFPR